MGSRIYTTGTEDNGYLYICFTLVSTHPTTTFLAGTISRVNVRTNDISLVPPVLNFTAISRHTMHIMLNHP